MYFCLYNGQKKRRKTPCLGLSPLRQYKDNTFSREMQIALTFRNNPRNVKRRVLHKTGFAMYYITRRTFGVFLGALHAHRCTQMHIDFVIVAIFFPEILQNTDVLLLLHKIQADAKCPPIRNKDRVYTLACEGFAAIVPYLFVSHRSHVIRYASSWKTKTYGTRGADTSKQHRNPTFH